MRLAVFLPNWVGDVIMATPAIRALRKLADGGEMIGVMRPYVADVLEGGNWFDEHVFYAKKSERREYQWPQVRDRLRAARFDAAVLLTNSLRTAWMAYRSGAPQRIGFARDMRGPLLTTRVYEPWRGWRRVPLTTIDGYLHVALAAGCDWEAPKLELATTPADEAAADAVWHRHGLPRGERVAVFNTGGAFGSAKDWPTEHFVQLARRLADERDLHVVINCGPAEREVAERIVDEADDPRVVSLADEPELPLGLTKAVIRRSQLLVSTDSGPRFMGVAFEVPTVSLFGPTSTRWTRTYGDVETKLALDLDCRPCMTRTCPLKHHRCMRDLSVERVYHAAVSALNKAPASSVAA